MKAKSSLGINFILFQRIKNKAKIIWTNNANLMKKVIVNSISRLIKLLVIFSTLNFLVKTQKCQFV
ncbi:hypothetical protein EAH81_25905 [Flavobacterium pectinovorum]|uniref:Uncharacterized protein n=1 Tax=Flavobacterium pectinovorum TaxID=29533 RepID=A0A502E6L5_9FLAO|nr:hypothetical protein EAH81_25905 [Flavobacterium pectinovorum]